MTSKKVMYSSLKNCDGFVEISRLKALYYYLIGYEFYMIVRNPVDRFLSFYKNKFITTTNKDQPSIKLFGEKTCINQIAEMLPDMYMKDGHLFPQIKTQGIFIKAINLYIPFAVSNVFKMESDIDLLEDFFEINIPHKNSTNGVHIQRLTSISKKIIKDLYKEDYKKYGYK